VLKAIAAAGLGLLAAGTPPPGGPRLLDPAIRGWTPEARERLDAFILAAGRTAASYDPTRPPVAAFDWDNTVFKHDMGDATMYWLLRHGKIRQPAGRDWAKTNPHLTPAARQALNAACDALADPGQPLPTATATACADTIFAVYDGGRTPGGEPAFDRPQTRTQHQAYAWLAQLLAGYTPAEIRDFARAAYQQHGAAPISATQTVGSHRGVTAWGRIYPQMKDLIGALRANGFAIWVVSASPQHVIEPVADLVGIPAERVIGIRTVLADGRATATLQGCGGIPAGPDAPMTFDRGKRCWLNKVVFGMPDGPAQLDPHPDPRMRPVFAAGDSDTDIAFMQDATGLKLAIDRQKTQLMCNAYRNVGGNWLVQPMFLQPLPPRAKAYPCSTAADHAGEPLRDETGLPIPDQADRAHMPGE